MLDAGCVISPCSSSLAIAQLMMANYLLKALYVIHDFWENNETGLDR